MMDHSLALPNSRTGPTAASWLVSCLLHAVLAIAAAFFLQHLQLAPQTEPFQWDVAVIAPLSTSVKSVPAAQPPIPPVQAVQEFIPPAKRRAPTIPRVEPTTTKQAASPVAESLQESDQEHPFQTEPIPSITTSPLETKPLSDVGPQQLPQDIFSEQITALLEDSTAPPEVPTTTNSAHTPFSSTEQLKSAKADYGWLAAIMAQWIQDLNKRYPAMLRTEGVQGKVTLKAMLHENGRLSDVRVVRSSGHTALDLIAVEDVQNGPPVDLSHPLDRAKMPVKFSINYDLRTVR